MTTLRVSVTSSLLPFFLFLSLPHSLTFSLSSSDPAADDPSAPRPIGPMMSPASGVPLEVCPCVCALVLLNYSVSAFIEPS